MRSLVHNVSQYRGPRGSLRTHVFERTAPAPTPWVVPVFVNFAVSRSRGAYEYERHQHVGMFEVIVVDRGVYRCHLNGEALTLKPGEVLVVKPGDWHADTCEPGLRYFGVEFHLGREFLGDEASCLFRKTATPAQQRVRVARRVFRPICKRFQAEAAVSDIFAAHVQDALLQEFFWRLVRVLPPSAICPVFLEQSEAYGFLTALHRLFDEEIGRHFSVTDMARRLGVGTSTLAHKCKALLGTSPAHAFLHRKIERAQWLLRTEDLSVAQVSDQLGFANPYHFSRAFKRQTGHAPSVNRPSAGTADAKREALGR
jgi:AraC family transcriptional activator of pobA